MEQKVEIKVICHSDMSAKEFLEELITAEIRINSEGKLRFHIDASSAPIFMCQECGKIKWDEEKAVGKRRICNECSDDIV